MTAEQALGLQRREARAAMDDLRARERGDAPDGSDDDGGGGGGGGGGDDGEAGGGASRAAADAELERRLWGPGEEVAFGEQAIRPPVLTAPYKAAARGLLKDKV